MSDVCKSDICGRTFKVNAHGVSKLKRIDFIEEDVWVFYMFIYNDGVPVRRVSQSWIGTREDCMNLPAYVACEEGQKTYTFPLCFRSH